MPELFVLDLVSRSKIFVPWVDILHMQHRLYLQPLLPFVYSLASIFVDVTVPEQKFHKLLLHGEVELKYLSIWDMYVDGGFPWWEDGGYDW